MCWGASHIATDGIVQVTTSSFGVVKLAKSVHKRRLSAKVDYGMPFLVMHICLLCNFVIKMILWKSRRLFLEVGCLHMEVDSNTII